MAVGFCSSWFSSFYGEIDGVYQVGVGVTEGCEVVVGKDFLYGFVGGCEGKTFVFSWIWHIAHLLFLQQLYIITLIFWLLRRVREDVVDEKHKISFRET